MFSLVFLALKAAGAKDWNSGFGISLTHSGKWHYIQFHHVFPKSLLKGRFDPRDINEIANMAFIAGGTNRQLSNKEPAVYLPGVIEKRGKEALTSQEVPLDPRLHALRAFPEFLQERRRMLADRVNAFLEG